MTNFNFLFCNPKRGESHLSRYCLLLASYSTLTCLLQLRYAAMVLLLTIGVGNVWGGAAVGTVMWAEDFSGYTENAQPSGSTANSHTGTTVYNGGSVTYTSSPDNTKVYTSDGPGTGNNLLVNKNNGYFKVENIPTGDATSLTLSYAVKGSGTLSISCSSNVSISGSTITVTSGTSFWLQFQNTKNDKNLRMDDFSVTVLTAGGCSNSVAVTKGSESYGEVTTIGSASVATCSSTAADRRVTITIRPDECYDAPTDLTWTKSSGTVTASRQSGPTSNGDGTYSYVYQFAQNNNGAGTFGVTCTAKAAGKTVNFDAGPGVSASSSLTETCDGSGVTLPNVTASGVCKGWTTFAGWATAAVSDSSTTSVTLYAAGAKFVPASNGQTLYAVYSKVKSGGGASWTLSTTAPSVGDSVMVAYYNGSKYLYMKNSGADNAELTVSAGIATPVANGKFKLVSGNNYGVSLENGSNYLHLNSSAINVTTARTNGDINISSGSSANSFIIKRHSGASSYDRVLTWSGTNWATSSTMNSGCEVYFFKKVTSTTYYCSDPDCCTPLGSINGLVSLTQGGNSVTIKDWSAVSYAGSYTIKMYKKNGASWDLVSGTSSSISGSEGTKTGVTDISTGVTFTGLVVESEYKFTVQAIAGSSAYCDGVETAVTEINSTDVSSTPFKFRYSIYIDDGTGNNWAHHYITPTANANEGSVSINLPAHVDSYQFKIYGGLSGNWGQTGTAEIPSATKWTLDGGNQVKLHTGAGGAYVFTVDYSTTNPGVTVTFPSADQAAGHKIYFDKSIIDDWGNTLKYRIGNGSHNQNQDFTLVPGTDQFYVTTTPTYGSMDAWQIANNVAWTGTPADADHGIYNYYHNDDTYDITRATIFFDYIVEEDITMVPSSKKNTENSCDFWYVDKTSGMLTHTATITTPSNGTINIAYTDVNSAAQNKTATTAGLAHRTILTVTATPATGYQLSTLTINGVAHTNGDTYILAADATIAATFTAKTYDVTLDPDGGSGSNQTVTATYDATMPTTLKGDGDIVLPNKTGYTFDGYYSEKNGGGTQYYTSTGASARTWNIDGETTLYAKWTLNSHTLTWNWGGGACSGTAGTHYTADGSVNYGTTINYPDESEMSKDGYDFTGWSTDVTSMPDANLTITAQWAIKHYTVTWLSNGSNYVTPVDYTHGAALALPAGTPSAPGGCSDKVFVGWTSDPEISTETSTKPTIISAGGAVNAVATYRAVFADVTGDPSKFKRVTQLSDITVGGEIVFGFYVSPNTKLCGLNFTGWTTYSCATGVDETSDKIPVPSDANIWTVSKESGYWVFTNKGDGTTKLATSSSSSNNELDPETQTYYKWNIGASSSGTHNFYVQLYNGSSLTNCALELHESTWKIFAPSTGSGSSKTYTYASSAYTALKLYVPAGSEDNYITLCSTCTTPSDVTASGITTDGATITWNGTSQENNGGSGTGFVVKYGTNSTRDENSNTINVAAGTNTADLTGLAQGTKYYVWVQSKCDNSWSTTPAEFTTLVSHTATFIGADGSTLQSSAIVEGESVTYSGSTPVSCDIGDGASTTFVGWATDTWEGKVAKGSIPVGTTFYDVVGGGESLPNMGNSDVTYYAVFAKATGDPLTNHVWEYTFTTNKYGSSGTVLNSGVTKTLDGTESAVTVNKDWTLQALGPWDDDLGDYGDYANVATDAKDNTKGIKIGTGAAPAQYMYFNSSAFTGTVTAVKISTSGGSMTQTTVGLTVDGTDFLNSGNATVYITNSNTEYSFTGSKTISGDEIAISWYQATTTTALYIKKIEVDYTTGGDVSYSNYMTTCSQCVTPNSVTADAITEAGATINWAGTSKTGTTGFTVLWGTDGTRANNSNSANVDADTKTYSITGLSAGTTYYVWVQSRCDGSWSDRISFTTKAIHTISFSTDNGTISSGATIDIVNGETLTFPSVTSTTCGTFVGWTIGDYDNTAAPSPFYTAGAEMADITAPAAYKAVYRTASGAETLVTDNLTATLIGVSTYQNWSGKTDVSSAVYAGNTTGSSAIQMRSSDNSGITTTTSGGDAKKVTITWNSNTTSGRTVDVYGKKAAYSSAADLYSAGTQGTKIGSIVYGTSTELEIDGDYQYIGLRSNSGALYIDNIAIQWYGSPMHYMTSPTCNPMVGITESLSSFTYAYGAGPSASQSFTVSGSNLTNNVTVAAPANYEVCLTAAGTYSSSVSIAQVAGEIDNTTVYIRLKESLNVGSYNGGVVTVSSTGASDATSAALTGSVTKAAATMAFTPDVYEATYEGSPVIVNFMLTLYGDGTVAYSRSPATGSRAVNTDGENTFTALQAGIWTITATHTPGDNYTKAANATATVRVKCVDTYVDFIHNKAVLTYGSGTPVTDGKMEDWGSGYTVPYVTDESEATSGSCQTTHFKFVGWVSEDEINIVEGTFKPGYTLISAGTAGKTASTKTYYAVWAKLED